MIILYAGAAVFALALAWRFLAPRVGNRLAPIGASVAVDIEAQAHRLMAAIDAEDQALARKQRARDAIDRLRRPPAAPAPTAAPTAAVSTAHVGAS